MSKLFRIGLCLERVGFQKVRPAPGAQSDERHSTSAWIEMESAPVDIANNPLYGGEIP